MGYKKFLNKLPVLVIFTYSIFGIDQVFAETKSYQKNSSDVMFYGQLFVQYDSVKAGDSGSTASVDGLRDDEGNGRIGVKGKSSIGNGYAFNYKVEYAIDIGDGDATGDSKTCSETLSDCRTFALKEGWLGMLTPFGEFKFGSVKSPYRYMARHDILHDTITQARDSRMITQSSMGHSSYWRESAFYRIKSGDLELAYIHGLGEGTGGGGHNVKKDYGYGIEFAISENHFLESGFEFSHRGGDINSTNYNVQYLNIPIQIKMKSRAIGYWKYFAKTGPSLAFRVKERVTTNLPQENEKHSKSALLIVNISVGAEYSLGNNTVLSTIVLS